LKHILVVIISFLLVSPLSGTASSARREVRVTAAQASVYDAPRATAVVIGQLPRGQALRATGRTNGDWVEVEAPPSISGWIFGELLDGDVVLASSVRIRSGAGIGHEPLGTLVKGDQVRRRGVQAGWVEFEGMPSMHVWVERAMVSAPAALDLTAGARQPPEIVERPAPPPAAPVPAAPQPAPAPVAVPSPSPAPPPAPAPAPAASPSAAPPLVAPPPPPPRPVPVPQDRPVPMRPPLRDASLFPAGGGHPAPARAQASRVEDILPPGYRLLAHAPQGQRVQLRGVVRPVGFGLFRPARFRLVADPANGPRQTMAYLLWADGVDVSRFAGRRVQLSGTRYWLVGVQYPVLWVQAVE
jgi:hypothetical protein